MNHKNSSRFALAVLTFLWAGVMALPAFAADELNFRKSVGDFWVYLAVMPADLVAGPPAAEPGATPFQPASARPAAQWPHSCSPCSRRRSASA